MGFFGGAEEARRRQNLQMLEDARLRFAEKMLREGFAPERMILVGTDGGGYAGLCLHDGKLCLAVSPDFGSDGEFTLHRFEPSDVRREEVFEAAEGMGGAFGFGKKGARGFRLILGDLSIPFITNRSSAAIAGTKNPLLSTKRRRANANLAWDLQPVDKRLLEKLERELNAFHPTPT